LAKNFQSGIFDFFNIIGPTTNIDPIQFSSANASQSMLGERLFKSVFGTGPLLIKTLDVRFIHALQAKRTSPGFQQCPSPQ
jgi:hypothetical protein